MQVVDELRRIWRSCRVLQVEALGECIIERGHRLGEKRVAAGSRHRIVEGAAVQVLSDRVLSGGHVGIERRGDLLQVLARAAYGGELGRFDLERAPELAQLPAVTARVWKSRAMLEETVVAGGAVTTAPPARPRWMESNPIWERMESPSRRVARLTASWPASSRSGGSEVPGCRLPERMRPRSPATTASTAVGGWATIPPLARTRSAGTRFWSDQNVAAFSEARIQLSIVSGSGWLW